MLALFVSSSQLSFGLALASSTSLPSFTPRVIERGQVTINGTPMELIEVLQNPPLYEPSSDPSGGPFPQPPGDFQYGVFMFDADGMQGAQFNLTEFEGEGNPSGFSIWVGITDNRGYFYQTTLTYWGPSSNGGAYTGGYGTNYPKNPYGLSGTYPISQPNQFNYHGLDDGQYCVLSLFVYGGQWYTAYFFSNGSSYIRPFPGGPDGGSYIEGAAGVVMEGGDSGNYTTGIAKVSQLSYVWRVTERGGALYLYVWYTGRLGFYRTAHAFSPPCELTVEEPEKPYTYVFTFNQTSVSSPYFSEGFGSPVPCAEPVNLPVALLTISASSSSVPVGASVNVTAHLEYANGTPIPDQLIQFYVNGSSLGQYYTSSRGLASVSYKPSEARVYAFKAVLVSQPNLSSPELYLTAKGSGFAWALLLVIIVIVVGVLVLYNYRSRKGMNSPVGGHRAT